MTLSSSSIKGERIMMLKANKILIAVGIVCLCLVTASTLWAGSDHGDQGWQCLTHNVQLTPDQQSKVKAIYDRYVENTKGIHEQLAAAESSEDQAGPFNEVAYRSAAETRARLQVDLEVAFAKARSEAESVLTPEQKTQLAEHMKQMSAHCHGSHK
jgi:Spy/CpxP family protein refolding chaperone